MGINSAFKRLKLLKTPGRGRLNNLNDPVLNVLKKLKRGTAETEKMNHIQSFYSLVLTTALGTVCRNIMIL